MKIDWNQKAILREHLLFGLVFLTFALVFFSALYLPLAEKRKAASFRNQQLTSEKAALANFLATTPALQKTEVLSRRKEIKLRVLFGEVLNVTREITELLTHVTEPVFLGGLEVQKIDYSPEAAETGYSEVDFHMNVAGSFSDLIRYLERLEAFPALFHLESVNVAVAEGQPQELNAEIAGRFFKGVP